MTDTQESIEVILADLNQTSSVTKVGDKLLAERIKELTKRAEEVKKIVEGYKKVAKDLKKKGNKLKEYYEAQLKALEAVVSEDDRKYVCKFVKEYQDETDKIPDPEALKKQLPELESALADAKRQNDASVADFAKLQEFQKRMEDAIKTLDTLKADNEKAEEEGEEQLMYFLIAKLFEEELNKKHYGSYSLSYLIDENNIEDLAKSKWRELNEKAKALQEAQQNLDNKKAEIASAEQRREVRKTERRAEIMSEIAEEFQQEEE